MGLLKRYVMWQNGSSETYIDQLRPSESDFYEELSVITVCGNPLPKESYRTFILKPMSSLDFLCVPIEIVDRITISENNNVTIWYKGGDVNSYSAVGEWALLKEERPKRVIDTSKTKSGVDSGKKEVK